MFREKGWADACVRVCMNDLIESNQFFTGIKI